MFISIGDHDVSDPTDTKSEIMPVRSDIYKRVSEKKVIIWTFFSKIIPHEKYDEDTTNNDIALIQLKKKIDFKKFKVKIIPSDAYYV